MATHSSTLARKIPWMEEPGRLQSMGSQRVRHDWVTSLHSVRSIHTLSLDKEMATHSSTFAWRITWKGEPGMPWSMGLQRVGHDWSDWASKQASLTADRSFPDSSVGKESTCNAGDPSSIPRSGRSPGEGKGYPLQYSGLENSTDYVHGVAKSWTWLSNFHSLLNMWVFNFTLL